MDRRGDGTGAVGGIATGAAGGIATGATGGITTGAAFDAFCFSVNDEMIESEMSDDERDCIIIAFEIFD